MQCIFSYCKADLSGDLFVVAFYATLVLVTVTLSFLARSRSIRTAASLIGAAWVFGLFAFIYVKLPAFYLVAVMLDTMLAYHFWRMAKVEFFPVALCLILLFEIAFVAFSLSVGLSTDWTLFVMNRLFEATLVYLVGCALFRIHIRRRRENVQTPVSGWRMSFWWGERY